MLDDKLLTPLKNGHLMIRPRIKDAGDECARAVGMVLRWKSGKWKSKGLIEV